MEAAFPLSIEVASLPPSEGITPEEMVMDSPDTVAIQDNAVDFRTHPPPPVLFVSQPITRPQVPAGP